MVSGIHIQNWIAEPKSLDNKTGEELEEWGKKYPWFASTYILSALAFKNSNSYKQRRALKLASLYTGDRHVLYQFINQKEKVLVETITETISEEITSETAAKNEASDLKIEKMFDKLKEEVDINEIVTYDPQKELLSKAEENQQAMRFELSVLYNPEKELLKYIDEEEEEVIENQEEVIAVGGFEFTKWFDQLDDEKPKPKKNKRPSVKTNIDEVAEKIKSFNTRRPSLAENHISIYNSDQKLAHSTDDSKGQMTETLAQIYRKQKLYGKAILVYETLKLQNPSNSTYFAAQITELLTLQKTE